MASLTSLQSDVAGWLKRHDATPRMPGWCRMVETDIAEQLRARCMIQRATQPMDAAFITLPVGFCTMESMRDAATGDLLTLDTAYTGPANAYCPREPGHMHYRLVGDCIEFLPHPAVPNPVPIGWQARCVNMAWYAAPKPLIDPQDTNPVLENLYSVYLFGMCMYGAAFQLDDDREKQMEGLYGAAILKANLWKQMSDVSGAPLRAVVKGF